jgi:glucokinase
VGTGIGTALVINGQIYRGLEGSHPEGGHMVLDPSGPLCYCKQHGCWESLCAGPAIERQAREANLTGSHLLELLDGDGKKIDARLVFDAARAGDRVAIQIIERVSKYFTQGVLNIAVLFTPDAIVLGGGVMRNVDLFLPDLQQKLQAYREMVPAHKIHVTPAQLGEYAGLYGSAYTIFKKFL